MIILTTLIIAFSLFLLICSIWDIKTRAIPSVFLTGMIFILVFLRFANVKYAILTGLFGFMIWEFLFENKTEYGLADIKVMIMLGFFINSPIAMGDFMILFAIGQLLYIFVMKHWLKINKQIPFVPFFFLIWVLGLIGGIFS